MNAMRCKIRSKIQETYGPVTDKNLSPRMVEETKLLHEAKAKCKRCTIKGWGNLKGSCVLLDELE